MRELTADPLGAPPSPTLAGQAAAAEGNARLLIELLQGLSEENTFTFAGGTTEVTSTALPERVHRVVRLLLADISSRCRLFIRLAALSGKEFELGAVAEPFGQPAGMLLPLVEEAADVGVIASVGDRLVFTQPLFWRAVLESLPEPMRAGARGESVRPFEPARPTAGAIAVQPWPAELREIDRVIATLVSDGLTNSQIATRLNRSPHKVSYHPRKMFGTLSVRSRSELAGTFRQRLWEAP
ncbi:LuxR C-terminal-related transcriptional regulator [Streptomyces mirabilis]|uniref:LuxR C-terminal-related transcriptional regulator n=1 Tax=Streptomyces mirabilis TaxID=68239 RepID=UPI00331DDFA9